MPPSDYRNRSRLRRRSGRDTRVVPAVGPQRWTTHERERALKRATQRVMGIEWSPELVRLVFEELYIFDEIDGALDLEIENLSVREIPTAIAIALLIRHSWRADDLAYMSRRLKLSRASSRVKPR